MINLDSKTEIRVLGSGGFGQTTLYEDEHQHRFVLKTFRPQGSNDSPKALAMFKAECDRLKDVGDHSQIPSYLGFEECDGKYAIAQQYIPGRSLRQILDDEGTYTPTLALKLLEDLLDPLEHLHRNRIIHRDIKPDNIIISLETGLPTIVDFGAAKLVTETVLAQTGTVIGTANYAAPEQLSGQTCFQSDLYSLGLTIIEIITGIRPHEQTDMYSGDSVWFASSNGVSPRFEAILNQMTTRYLRDRYQDISAIRSDIRELKTISDQEAQDKQAKAEQWLLLRRFLIRRVVPTIAAIGLAGWGGVAAWKAIDEPVTQFLGETLEKISPKSSSESNPKENAEGQIGSLINLTLYIANLIAIVGVGLGVIKMMRSSVEDESSFGRVQFVIMPIMMLLMINIFGKFLFGEFFSQEEQSSMSKQPKEHWIQMNTIDPLDPINQLGC